MELEDLIAQVERDLRTLKLAYEKYFKGEARRAPLRERATLQGAVEQMIAGRPGSTALKFKVQAVSAQYHSAANYWDRIMAQIEAGAYAPDRFKADLRVGRLGDLAAAAPKGVAGQAADAPPTAAPPATAAPGGEPDLHKLYEDFVASRRTTGENAGISYAAFAHSIEKQRPMLEAKFGKSLQLKVVIEDGKAKVKSVGTPTQS